MNLKMEMEKSLEDDEEALFEETEHYDLEE
jgi:hypothetical protein